MVSLHFLFDMIGDGIGGGKQVFKVLVLHLFDLFTDVLMAAASLSFFAAMMAVAAAAAAASAIFATFG